MLDSSKSLEQLENDFWKKSDFPTPLIEKCFLYRQIPLRELTIEQIRLLIGQNISLKFTIPKALEFLNVNILSEGDYYEGDLLSAVLSSDKKFWLANPNTKQIFISLLLKNKLEISNKKLTREIDNFISS